MEILLTVETDLFEHRQLKPHFINPCCFGEDFAGWLIREISPITPEFKLSEPIQEDYGWGFWARRGKDSFWVAISYVGSGPQEPPAQWVISVNPDYGLNLIKRLFHNTDERALGRLRDSVRNAIVANPEVKIVGTPDYGDDTKDQSLC